MAAGMYIFKLWVYDNPFIGYLENTEQSCILFIYMYINIYVYKYKYKYK